MSQTICTGLKLYIYMKFYFYNIINMVQHPELFNAVSIFMIIMYVQIRYYSIFLAFLTRSHSHSSYIIQILYCISIHHIRNFISSKQEIMCFLMKLQQNFSYTKTLNKILSCTGPFGNAVQPAFPKNFKKLFCLKLIFFQCFQIVLMR